MAISSLEMASNRCSKSLAKAANFFLKDSLILQPEYGQIRRSRTRQKKKAYCRICALIFLLRSASFSNNAFHAASRSESASPAGGEYSRRR